MASGALQIEPLSSALGAEVVNLDLSTPPSAETLAAIHRALDEHMVIVFRDQTLTPAQLLSLTRQFGPVLRVPFIEPLAGHPDIVAVLKEPEERNISTFGGTWHSDFSFLTQPPSYTLLYALEVPPWGGDTIWANMTRAYQALSKDLRDLLDGLSAIHTGTPYGTHGPPPDLPVSRSVKMRRGDPAADIETAHPVVRLVGQAGRPALFVNPVYTTRFDGMTAEESRPLLDMLQAQAVRAENTCRLRWHAGTLAMWDNRATQHMAVNDYDGHRRLLYRTTVAGDRPRGQKPALT